LVDGCDIIDSIPMGGGLGGGRVQSAPSASEGHLLALRSITSRYWL
jgi:4-diphosphocytidyl-2C-methyl-D-erythritol kinase